jgi:hypothetical protein
MVQNGAPPAVRPAIDLKERDKMLEISQSELDRLLKIAEAAERAQAVLQCIQDTPGYKVPISNVLFDLTNRLAEWHALRKNYGGTCEPVKEKAGKERMMAEITYGEGARKFEPIWTFFGNGEGGFFTDPNCPRKGQECASYTICDCSRTKRERYKNTDWGSGVGWQCDNLRGNGKEFWCIYDAK